MKVYKFRLLTDEHDDFVRDIEFCEDQTFYDFYLAILQTTTLAGNELSSFFVCDPDWEKQAEITLLDMHGPEESSLEDGIMKQYVMLDAYIEDFITHPRQRFLYEYDFLNPVTFFIELIEVTESRKDVMYPYCSYRKGLLKQSCNEEAPANGNEDLDEADLLKDFNDLLYHTMENDEDDEL
ncbi:MAG: hypothetical protein PHU97_09940 [Bacteroidales bacterium]|nr:hypothetical protein [Bacteroidales bacterium]MDD3961022.1 hypothetical protein [Bacteroidales bacterium]HPE86698.1 hypothetical protein [Bacteroidales bacterium]